MPGNHYRGMRVEQLTANDFARLNAMASPRKDIHAAFRANGMVGQTRSGLRGASADMAYWIKQATGLSYEQLFDRKKDDKYYLSDSGATLIAEWQRSHGESPDRVIGRNTVGKMEVNVNGGAVSSGGSRPAESGSSGILTNYVGTPQRQGGSRPAGNNSDIVTDVPRYAPTGRGSQPA